MEKKKKVSSYNSLWVCMTVVCIVASLTSKHAAAGVVSCGDAVNALIPCGSYLIGEGPNDPSAQCCSSAQALKKMVSTVASRRALCECFKETGPFGVKPERAKHLPPFCKLNLNITITTNINCTLLQ
ncbi:hypothetical protein J5N97_002757 [Dioscorea zingiberensis]|uniref:Bifunctional inhibitor/plant lipid transfer protein/seed storage helical domain-containing protein n=1 Tax=Dioscorea zingiberensis TaxID=325984 RepID=A0A9D5D3C3_9LILI|nr:hypothetical protein J5N97_002757 [Dioscorea zingiberensis]